MKRLPVCFAALRALALVIPAHADTVFTFTASGCSSSCGTLPAGTVTLHQVNPDEVLVTVDLNSPYDIHQTQNDNHEALAFDLVSSITPSSVSISNFSSNVFSYAGHNAGGYMGVSGQNSFDYAISADSTSTNLLSFDISDSSGLTIADFIANDGYYFSTDVSNLSTGNDVATLNQGQVTTTVTPEPSSLVLLGTGILGLAGAARRRFVRA